MEEILLKYQKGVEEFRVDNASAYLAKKGI